jgi:YD repeat-containing protein
VTFKDGATTLGTGSISGGVAALNTTFSATGSHSLTAVYGGDSNNTASTSSAMAETINASASTTSLTSSANPAAVSQSVTLTATVTGNNPSGTVTFKDGTVLLGAGVVTAGMATFNTNFTSGGAHSLVAMYSGDINNTTSTSSAYTETVTKIASSTVLTSSANPAILGQNVTLVATVTGNNPSGIMTFKDGSTALGTGTISSGVATLTISFTSSGAHSLTAIYGGDISNQTSTSTIVAQTVTPQLSGPGSGTYVYDPLGRLTSLKFSNGDTVNYYYDPSGNRTGYSITVH